MRACAGRTGGEGPSEGCSPAPVGWECQGAAETLADRKQPGKVSWGHMVGSRGGGGAGRAGRLAAAGLLGVNLRLGLGWVVGGPASGGGQGTSMPGACGHLGHAGSGGPRTALRAPAPPPIWTALRARDLALHRGPGRASRQGPRHCHHYRLSAVAGPHWPVPSARRTRRPAVGLTDPYGRGGAGPTRRGMGTWRTTGSGRALEGASVVCRQLGCGRDGAPQVRPAARRAGAALAPGVSCRGTKPPSGVQPGGLDEEQVPLYEWVVVALCSNKSWVRVWEEGAPRSHLRWAGSQLSLPPVSAVPEVLLNKSLLYKAAAVFWVLGRQPAVNCMKLAAQSLLSRERPRREHKGR